MRSPLSVDLRERVVAAVAEGASCHGAAARFGVNVSSASHWSARFQQTGEIAAKPSGGGHASVTFSGKWRRFINVMWHR